MLIMYLVLGVWGARGKSCTEIYFSIGEANMYSIFFPCCLVVSLLTFYHLPAISSNHSELIMAGPVP